MCKCYLLCTAGGVHTCLVVSDGEGLDHTGAGYSSKHREDKRQVWVCTQITVLFHRIRNKSINNLIDDGEWEIPEESTWKFTSLCKL